MILLGLCSDFGSTLNIIHNNILKNYPELNDQQKEIINHIDGPLLVIADPGSGKTYSLVLRAINSVMRLFWWLQGSLQREKDRF